MAAHPRKAVPGAVHGRPRVLPPERAGEVYELAARGWTVQDMADQLGVSSRALYYARHRVSAIRSAFLEGRAERPRRLAAAAAARLAAERRRMRKDSRAALRLLGIAEPPQKPATAPPVSPEALSLPPTLPPDAVRLPSHLNLPPMPVEDEQGEYISFDPMPLDDPF